MFTLTGDAMTHRGDFFASMFIVLAAGCLVVYFVMGWSVNVVAQVITAVPAWLLQRKRLSIRCSLFFFCLFFFFFLFSFEVVT